MTREPQPKLIQTRETVSRRDISKLGNTHTKLPTRPKLDRSWNCYEVSIQDINEAHSRAAVKNGAGPNVASVNRQRDKTDTCTRNKQSRRKLNVSRILRIIQRRMPAAKTTTRRGTRRQWSKSLRVPLANQTRSCLGATTNRRRFVREDERENRHLTNPSIDHSRFIDSNFQNPRGFSGSRSGLWRNTCRASLQAALRIHVRKR